MRCTYIGAAIVSLFMFVGCTQQSAERANRPDNTSTSTTAANTTDQPSADSDEMFTSVRDDEPSSTASSPPESTEATLPGDSLVKIDAEQPAEVQVGRQFTYTLNVTNTSSDKMLRDVKVKHSLPEGMSIEKSEPAQDDKQSDHASWTFSELAPGATKKIEITATSDKEGTAQQCLSVTYTPAICLTTRFVKPDVSITKQMPQQASLCEVVTAQYQVRNDGSGAAQGLMLVDELPEGLTTVDGEQQVKIDVGNVPAGESRQFKAQLVATKTGEFGSRATVQQDGENQARSNHAATEFESAQLVVAIQGPKVEYVNEPMTYTVKVRNDGNTAATGVKLTVAIPQDIQLVRMSEPQLTAPPQPEAANKQSATPAPLAAVAAVSLLQAEEAEAAEEPSAEDKQKRGLDFALGNLAPQEETQVQFTVIGRAGKELTFKAAASFDCDTSRATETTTSEAIVKAEVIALPALLITAIDNRDPINVDGQVRYTIVVANEGQAEDKNVQVTATLPAEMEFVDASGPTKGTHAERKVTFEKIDTLNAGEKATYHVTAKVIKEGSVRFKAELTSDSVSTAATSEEPTRLFKAGEEEAQDTSKTPAPEAKSSEASAEESKE